MKNIINACSLLLVACLCFSSCKKEEDEGKLPNISFKTDAGYTSGDATVAKNTAVKIGIVASKAEDNDLLTKFTIVRSVNGGADSTMYTEDLAGSKGDNYSYDLSTSTTTAQSEKYTFSVVNKDGLINKVSLTLNVE
ncbi:MAG: hypothetical protein JST70_17445 [Bacteroidetes bacterium]|nr:hypothetical protein [Bacteroidota bacterium]